MNDNVSGTVIPIRLTVRLLDDDGPPSPRKVHAVLADEAGQEHRFTIAPDATDADPGAGAAPGDRPRTGPQHMTARICDVRAQTV